MAVVSPMTMCKRRISVSLRPRRLSSQRANRSVSGTSCVSSAVLFCWACDSGLLTIKTDKVIDSSDVILHVIDARDPNGTRCRHVEKYLATEAPHKHLIFVLNKIDLVPSKTAVSLYHPFLPLASLESLHLPRANLEVPRDFVRIFPAFICTLLGSLGLVCYIAGRLISTSQLPWSRLGIGDLKDSVLEDFTGYRTSFVWVEFHPAFEQTLPWWSS